MTLNVSLHHKTRYLYDRPVRLSTQTVRLKPTVHNKTPILSYSLKILPENHFINWIQDPYGNHIAQLNLPDSTRELCIEVDLIADMTPTNPFDFFLEEKAAYFPITYSSALTRQLALYFEKTALKGPFEQWIQNVRRNLLSAQTFSTNPVRLIDELVHLNQIVHQSLEYKIRLEPGVQNCNETLTLKSGSCRDMTWLLLQTLRHLGFATRFVSGYLIQLKPDQKPVQGAEGPTSDFLDLHAWAEVYLPGAGWIGLDPTSGLLTGEGHIPLACVASPPEAAPLEGLVDECEVEFEFEMKLRRIEESPRATRPYTETQWKGILKLGDQVDDDLNQMQVPLTMGGEPTFVSEEDRQGEEWHTTASGPLKKTLSDKLIRRLRTRFAPGGVLHYGQGKWYGGEPLPRWALGCYWRADGKPVWEDVSLLDRETPAEHYTSEQASLFIRELSSVLRVSPQFITPAYEDIWQALISERNLPVNLDPLRFDLDSPDERKLLQKIFTQGLKSVVGYVLPLRSLWNPSSLPEENTWQSGPWFFRDQTLFLIPGNSPMGFRLPLDSLFWEHPQKQSQEFPRDPFSSRANLPDYQQITRQRRPLGLSDSFPSFISPEIFHSQNAVIRTALCVEPRNGHLHIFLPPIQSLEAWLDLIASIEQTAMVLKIPVILEGYPPPCDSRLKSFKITPDPGVIEVNIHPSSSWREIVEKTEILYEEARQVGLTAEKFLIDGRESGTGGGNHITLGGPTPQQSPLLTRPDLLGSLLRFWQNHPSLSYLFSSLFIGPTSQAPRIDEARDDTLYEAAIALEQLDQIQHPFPWTVDRLFRNVLIDSTGNTHRTEFCIDKLYSPDGPDGRLGLLELRCFEMPPHPQMYLAQTLLVRTLVAAFLKKPYTRPLIHWGNHLHDRFMLPHFISRDFADVLQDLKDAGYPFEMEWFAPFFELRFPLIGEVNVREMTLELRQALEPWHVLGEEMTSLGTSRYVDSSVERLEVRLKGVSHPRYWVTCNGRPLPLKSTGVLDEKVAGVRFRAWGLASALHPTLPVDSPLVFDIVDSWTGISLGGCRYHVSHPGGRSYDLFPVNNREAASRREERFIPWGHTPGEIIVNPEGDNALFPCTLDLRRQPASSEGFGKRYDPKPGSPLVNLKATTRFSSTLQPQEIDFQKLQDQSPLPVPALQAEGFLKEEKEPIFLEESVEIPPPSTSFLAIEMEVLPVTPVQAVQDLITPVVSEQTPLPSADEIKPVEIEKIPAPKKSGKRLPGTDKKFSTPKTKKSKTSETKNPPPKSQTDTKPPSLPKKKIVKTMPPSQTKKPPKKVAVE